MIKFGHAPFKFIKLRQFPRLGLSLFQLLRNVDKAAVHIRQGPCIWALCNTGGKLFNRDTKGRHVTVRGSALAGIINT